MSFLAERAILGIAMAGSWNGTQFNGDDTNDDATGTQANEALWGNRGDDVLRGEGGNDFIDGGVDNDQLFGGDGNDILVDVGSIPFGFSGSSVATISMAAAVMTSCGSSPGYR